MNIQSSTSYLVNGKIKNNTFTIKNIDNIDEFFDRAIQSAGYLQRHFVSDIKKFTIRTHDSLFIDYTSIPFSQVIDRQYLVVD